MSEALLIGAPNSGKSLLFNRLTGLHQKVANFPGVTVDVHSGQAVGAPGLRLVDYPGLYSLKPVSGEERVAVEAFRKALEDGGLDRVVCIVDATRLERGLHFAMQVLRECQRQGKPALVALNMMDVLERHGIELDAEALAAELGAPVVALSARTGNGLDRLRAALSEPRGDADAGLADLDDDALRARAHELARRFGPRGDLLIKSQNRLDAFLLHSWLGGLAFAAIMFVLFQSIFTWAAPAMDAVEAVVGWLATVIVPLVPTATLQAFVEDALFGGIGAFVVFIPQIFVLTLVVGILEDSGYLARAAVICHRPLRFFGLTGKSFIPLLSGMACAIPAIYAARTIDSPYRRWLTWFAIPLMPCSARLPVYALLIAAFVPAQTALGGLVGLQGLAMFLIYFLGIAMALLVTAVLSRAKRETRDKSDFPFVLEMPPYRLPSWVPLLRNAFDRSKHFVTKAGPIIFVVTVVVWVLGYFPNFGEDLGASYLGRLGTFIEPVFEPLGLDWRYGVALLTAFLAREVFVGTLGTLFGIEGAEEDIAGLADQIQASGLSLASGAAIVVFFVIALQCVSTLAVLRREAGSRWLPVQMFIAYGVLAYVLGWVTYTLVGLL